MTESLEMFTSQAVAIALFFQQSFWYIDCGKYFLKLVATKQ
ncbi:hypothetical protein [Nostoc sp. TCL26-01]|nr:hypothetical protein [Nostoc sp. TCL26-01]